MSKQEATKQSVPSKTTSTPTPDKKGKGKTPSKRDDNNVPEEEAPNKANSKGKTTPPKMWADPLSPAVPPNWDFLLSRGYISKLSFEFTAFGTSTMVHIPGETDPATGQVLVVVRSARDALQHFKDRGILDKTGRVPDSVKKGKGPAAKDAAGNTIPKKNAAALPKSSLCKEDFGEDVAHLRTRVASIKANLGFTSVRGRILSIFHPDREAIPTVEAWWAGAPPFHRLRVLCDEKRLVEIEGIEETAKAVKSMMPQIGCPFLGALTPQKGTPKASGSKVPKGTEQSAE